VLEQIFYLFQGRKDDFAEERGKILRLSEEIQRENAEKRYAVMEKKGGY